MADYDFAHAIPAFYLETLAETRTGDTLMKIYVAGPYTKGDVIINIRNAIYAGNFIANIGHTPFIPHLTAFWHMLTPNEDINFWYDYDIEWLKVCDALYRIEGESIGADNEVRIAKELGMEIYTNLFLIPKAKGKE